MVERGWLVPSSTSGKVESDHGWFAVPADGDFGDDGPTELPALRRAVREHPLAGTHAVVRRDAFSLA
jgi:hypothetical protein